MRSRTTDSTDYKVTCDYSGFVCMRSECVVMWNGLLVRKDFAEDRRHPQDTLPTIQERPFTGITRNEQADPPLADPFTESQII